VAAIAAELAAIQADSELAQLAGAERQRLEAEETQQLAAAARADLERRRTEAHAARTAAQERFTTAVAALAGPLDTCVEAAWLVDTLDAQCGQRPETPATAQLRLSIGDALAALLNTLGMRVGW
jgi:hypothetical protein